MRRDSTTCSEDFSVENIYNKVFGREQGEFSGAHAMRLVFLDQVVTGITHINHRDILLENAIKREKDDHIKREYIAAYAMRDMYLSAEKTSRNEAIERVKGPLRIAKVGWILDVLDECVEVLYRHRIQKLKGLLKEAFSERPNCGYGGIIATAETLYATGNPDLQKFVIEEMEKYHKSLKSVLNEALPTNNASTIGMAAESLFYTGVPHLEQYAWKKLQEYERKKSSRTKLFE